MEVAQIIVSALTPLAIAVVGYLIQQTLARQNRSWKAQERMADKRVEIYEEIGEDLNKIYCYVMDIGDFRNETPDTILDAKRLVDKHMYMYQALWPEETFAHYLDYMDSAFATNQGVGESAKIRGWTREKRAAWEKSDNEWPSDWDTRFTKERDSKHGQKYRALISRISSDLMLSSGI